MKLTSQFPEKVVGIFPFEISPLNRLKNVTRLILGCMESIGLMKEAVDQMYQIFRAITDIGIEDQNDETIFLQTGKAISPSMAAHCLLYTTLKVFGDQQLFEGNCSLNMPLKVCELKEGESHLWLKIKNNENDETSWFFSFSSFGSCT